MTETGTLGVLAHRGGLLVERPELTVGVVRAVSRPSGLELELLARRPLDRRTALERQADLRAGRGRGAVAPRRLLPEFDEGIDLRVGWLDSGGRPHWEFGSNASSSGDGFEGGVGPSVRTVLHFPPLFDQVSLVLAWPEIGFPETVVSLPLPDRATVERETRSIWQAPLDARPAPEPLNHRIAPRLREELAIEAGRIVAAPRVLHRGKQAAVVLSRLTAVGPALSMELLSVAEGAVAEAVAAAMFPPPHRPFSDQDDPALLRRNGPGASVAMLRGGDALWVRIQEGWSAGGDDSFVGTYEFVLSRPDDGALDLLIAWPVAGLADVRVRIPLDP